VRLYKIPHVITPRGIVNIPLSPTFHSYLQNVSKKKKVTRCEWRTRKNFSQRVRSPPLGDEIIEVRISQGRRIPRMAIVGACIIGRTKYLGRILGVSASRQLLYISLADKCQIVTFAYIILKTLCTRQTCRHNGFGCRVKVDFDSAAMAYKLQRNS